jgi:hypothetical protein
MPCFFRNLFFFFWLPTTFFSYLRTMPSGSESGKGVPSLAIKHHSHRIQPSADVGYICPMPDCYYRVDQAKIYYHHLRDLHGLSHSNVTLFTSTYQMRKIRVLAPLPLKFCPHHSDPCDFFTNKAPHGPECTVHLRVKHKEPSPAFTDMLQHGRLFFWWEVSSPRETAIPPVLRDKPVDRLIELYTLSEQFDTPRLDTLDSFWEKVPGDSEDEDEVVQEAPGHAEPEAQAGSVPYYSNLRIPTVLAPYNLALLTLDDFPNRPVHLVCLRCHRVLTSRNFAILYAHTSKCSGANSTNPEEHEETHQPEEDDDGVPDMEEPELDPVDEEDAVVEDSEDEERHPQRSLHQATRRAAVAYVKDVPLPLIVYPSSPIGRVPFFPLLDGYGCPAEGCSMAYGNIERARAHFRQEHTQDMWTEAIQCKVQSLSHKGISSGFFQVLPADVPMYPVQSVHDAYDSAQHRFTHVEGLSSPESRHAFLVKFGWDQIFPTEREKRATFAEHRLVNTTFIHLPHTTQKPEHQLLHIAVYEYMARVRRLLQDTQERYRLHFGNKLRYVNVQVIPSFPPLVTDSFYRYDNLDLNTLKTPFRPLQRHQSLVVYCQIAARFVAYVLKAITHSTEEQGDILLPEALTTAGRNVWDLLCRLSDRPSVFKALLATRNLPKANSSDAITGDAKLDEQLRPAIDELKPVLHAFMWALLCHPSGQGPDTPNLSLPISRFLALTSYNPVFKNFSHASRLAQDMAKLQWAMRSIAFYEFYLQCRNAPSPPTDQIVNEILRSVHDATLLTDSSTPFGALQGQLNYAQSLHIGALNVATTMWSSVTQTAHYNGIPVPFPKFKSLVHATLKRAENTLFDYLLFGSIPGRDPPRPKVVVDNVRDGTCYLERHINPGFYRGLQTLRDHIMSKPDLCARFCHSFASVEGRCWNVDAVFQYLDKLRAFQYDLAFLVYLLGGQVPRGTELLSLRRSSTPTAHRSIFALQGHMVLYQQYSKTDSITGRAASILRMTPFPISRLIETYLVLVRPLEQFFWTIFAAPSLQAGAESLLFAPFGEKIAPRILSLHIKGLTTNALGPTSKGLGFRGLRQVTTLFAMQMLPREVTLAPLTPTALAHQSGHSDRTAGAHYANLIDLSFVQLNTAQCDAFRTVSLHWHQLFGFEHPDPALQLRGVSVEANALVEVDIHRLATTVGDRLLPTLVAQVTSATEEVVLLNRVQTSAFQAGNPRVAQPYHPTRLCTLQALRALFKSPAATWRSQEQALAVEHATRRDQTPLVTVLPTGLGKSLLYQIPALLEQSQDTGRYTLLLVPLRALLHASHDAALQFGIHAHAVETDWGFSPPRAHLIIATFHVFLQNGQFRTWINNSRPLISRIVVDEAHTIFNDLQRSPEFGFLISRLLQVMVPLIFMTGTLPPATQDLLLQQLVGVQRVCLVRAPTDRLNVSYRVFSESMNRMQFAQHVQDHVLPHFQEHPEDRCIIFCRNVEDCKEIAGQIGSLLYYREKEESLKRESLELWLTRAKLPDSRNVSPISDATLVQ